MKKWMFVIFPGIMLVLFLIFYKQDQAAFDAKEAARAVAVAKQKEVEDAHVREVQKAAHDEAEKRAQELTAEHAKAEKDKQDKWDAQGKKIQDDTDKYTAEVDRNTKRASELEIELTNLNKKKEADNRDDFDTLKRIELARVAQSNAELEIQRMVEMIARRADQSSMTQMPPPPPPAKE